MRHTWSLCGNMYGSYVRVTYEYQTSNVADELLIAFEMVVTDT